MTSFIQERKLTIPGFTLAYKAWNSESQRPVLCLHGKLDNAASFDLIAPLLPHSQLIAVDYPGAGYSSHYPPGVMPHWKNDAFLMLNLIDVLGLTEFDIVAHSLGSLLASMIAVARPAQVGRLIFLDILGPTLNAMQRGANHLQQDLAIYLDNNYQHSIFADKDAAIQNRMQIGNISHQAACALVERGVEKNEKGWSWTFDSHLHCVGTTLPGEDELNGLFKAIETPVYLIRARQGVHYPDGLFQQRAQSIKHLTIHEIGGGHHVHMDDPVPVAEIISCFLDKE